MKIIRQYAPIAVLACVAIAGCGPNRPSVAPVKGKVTYAGRPVAQGTVMFYPESGRAATGRIGPDGTYSLTTFDTANDGALIGKHRVTIDAVEITAGQGQPKSFKEEIQMAHKGVAVNAAAPKRLVPEKYARRETSPLTAEVKSGENVLNFDIP